MKNQLSMEDFYQKKWADHKGFWFDIYKRQHRLYADGLYTTRNVRILEVAGEKISSILDIGCGIGDLVYFLSKHSDIAVGVDISRTNVNLARQNLLDHDTDNSLVLQSSAIPLPFMDNSFDLVIMADVIEHIEDAFFACQEVERVLRPGGRFICVTPHRLTLAFWKLADSLIWLPANVILQGKAAFSKKPQPESVYEYFFSGLELRKLITRSGLEIMRRDRICFFPGPEGGGEFQRYITFFYKRLSHEKFQEVENILSFLMTMISKVRFLNQKMLFVARKK